MNNILFRTLMLKGEAGATITSIEKLETSGGVMQMRIHLSDNTFVDFPVNDVPDEDLINQLIAAQTNDLKTVIRETLLSSGWSSSAPYSYTMNAAGVLPSDNFEIVGYDPTDSADTNNAIKEALGYITYGTTSADTITLIAYNNKPLVDIPIVLRKVVG